MAGGIKCAAGGQDWVIGKESGQAGPTCRGSCEVPAVRSLTPGLPMNCPFLVGRGVQKLLNERHSGMVARLSSRQHPEVPATHTSCSLGRGRGAAARPRVPYSSARRTMCKGNTEMHTVTAGRGNSPGNCHSGGPSGRTGAAFSPATGCEHVMRRPGPPTQHDPQHRARRLRRRVPAARRGHSAKRRGDAV